LQSGVKKLLAGLGIEPATLDLDSHSQVPLTARPRLLYLLLQFVNLTTKFLFIILTIRRFEKENYFFGDAMRSHQIQTRQITNSLNE